MDELGSCVYWRFVNCGCHNCDKCGWHPAVMASRKKRLREEGKDALQSRKKAEAEEEKTYCVRFILRNYKEYGGSLGVGDIKKRLVIGDAKLAEYRKEAATIVQRVLGKEMSSVR